MFTPANLQIQKFTGANPAQFYIQSHGNLTGKPLQTPSAQCLSVFTDCPSAFDIASCLYEANAYAFRGKAFPNLSADSATAVLIEALSWPFCPNALGTLRVALYEAANAREIADEWLTYARSFARHLYQSTQASATSAA